MKNFLVFKKNLKLHMNEGIKKSKNIHLIWTKIQFIKSVNGYFDELT